MGGSRPNENHYRQKTAFAAWPSRIDTLVSVTMDHKQEVIGSRSNSVTSDDL